jgi:hypothetical protein
MRAHAHPQQERHRQGLRQPSRGDRITPATVSPEASRLAALEERANQKSQARKTAQFQEDLNGGSAAKPVLQPKLVIANREISEDRINRGSYKKKLNSVLSEETRRAHLAPVAVRQELIKMAQSNQDYSFDTRREAVLAAIGRLSGVATEETQLSATMEDVEALGGFPSTEAWRLLMDGKHQATRGKFGFENEKGYMAAMMRSFRAMLGNLGQKLTAESYEELHDLAAGNVLTRKGERMETGFRNSRLFREGFGVDEDTWSMAGYEELEQKYEDRDSNPVGANLVLPPAEMVGPGVERKIMQIKPMLRSQCIRFANVVINLFYEQIEKAESEDEKLEAIARCAQDLDQLHLFADANIRTIAFLVVNKLLLENGLDPVILDEPNVFDCKSIGELKSALRKGQQTFRSYKRS